LNTIIIEVDVLILSRICKVKIYIIDGDETEPPSNSIRAYKKWKVKPGRPLFVLKPTVNKSPLSHIKDIETLKEARCLYRTIFKEEYESDVDARERTDEFLLR
jgi:hypothetical protein